MPIIKPISDLRNKSSEISELVHKKDEPVFITKNGEGDMVVMSIKQFNLLQGKLDLYDKLAAAQIQKLSGDQGRSLTQVMRDVRRKIKHVK